MLQPDHVQAFRSVHKSQPSSTTSAPLDSLNITHIDCLTDPETQKNFILSEDIFDGALLVRDKTKMLPYLKDQTTDRWNHVGLQQCQEFLVEEAMQNYNHIERPATSQLSSKVLQAIPARDQHNGDWTQYLYQEPTYFRDDRHSETRCPSRTRFSFFRGTDADHDQCKSRKRGRPSRSRISFIKATEQNNAQAQFMFGVLYFQDKTFEQNIPIGQCDGVSVQVDETIPKDNAKALEWFLKAAHQGLADAQFGVFLTMIEVYSNPDPETALAIVDWCRKAANQNQGLAQIYMGAFYLTEDFVPKDESIASK
ncbi:hypothetical protein EC991_008913 [Linnemannia zychae]|nr:hypothetical protein EC991_008913 [Linnemannia zychae]